MRGQGPKGQFDPAHLKAIHRHLFQDVYEWGGRTRDERVALSDGVIATEPVLRKIDGKAFMDELAREAGYSLNFSVVSRERMIQASINEKSDPSMMSRLFNEISDPARVAALKKAIEGLEKHGLSWNDRYIATMEPGHKVDVRLAGVAGEQFMARTETAVLIGQTRDLPEMQPERGRDFVLVPTSWGREPKEAIGAHAGKIRERMQREKERQQSPGADRDDESEG